MTVAFFFIHCLCSDIWMLEEGMLIPFTMNHVLVFVIFLKIEIGWATLVDDAFDVLAVFIFDVR